MKIAGPGYSMDAMLNYLKEKGGSVGQDNDGQFVIYTGLTENKAGELVEMDDA